MAKGCFNKVVVRGVCTVIPRNRICIDDERSYYADPAKLQKLKKTVGLNTRAVAGEGVTPSDMMVCAARRLLADMRIDVQTIDCLICVLDNPDYKCPPTACVLHGKLGMSTGTIAFDVTHGCAGYVYGLYLAHAMIESGAAGRILLLVGDTKSHTIDVRDRISAPLFGDGAAATLLERGEDAQKAYFVLGANGTLHENIMIPAGGARLPSSVETRRPKVDEYGNVRSLENFTMNGRAVFDFTMSAVPENIKAALAYSGMSVSELDYLVLHQANKSILQNIAVRTGVLDMKKVPTETLSRYGNLAVASIPSVLNDQLSEALSARPCTLLLSGFGVGLAFGTAILKTSGIYAPKPFIYEEITNE